MKFRVTMKDPDTLIDACADAAKESANAVEGLSAAERADVVERRKDELYDLAGEWFGYGEYLTVEIDTDAKTCVVVKDKP